MKSFVYALLAGVSLIAGAEARADAAAEIQAVLDAQRDAWNHGDVDTYMDGYAHSDETEFVGGDTVTRGWQTVRDRYKKKYDTAEKMGALTFSDVKITLLSADAALATGHWEIDREKDKPRGRFTLIFRHTPAGWRIVHDHTSAAVD